jgi:uncharacterized membrane protein YdjX (TVP38/TMEM64 family)
MAAKTTNKDKWKHRVMAIVTVLALVALVGVVWKIGLKSLHDHAAQWNGWIVFFMLLILPVFGAPVSVLFVLAGARFGTVGGLAITAGCIAFHLAATWWIAHSWLHRAFDALLKYLSIPKPDFPKGDQALMCLLVALVPGPPYTAKNYFLALSGASFGTFFIACLPAHFFTIALGVLFGDFTGEMSATKIVFLSVYLVLLFGITAYGVKRLRKRTGH